MLSILPLFYHNEMCLQCNFQYQNTLSASTGVFSTCSNANTLSNGNPCRQVHHQVSHWSLPRYERQWYNWAFLKRCCKFILFQWFWIATQHSNSTSHQLLKTPISTPSNQLLSREYTCEWMDRAWLGIPILEAELSTVSLEWFAMRNLGLFKTQISTLVCSRIGYQTFPNVSLRVDGEKSVINCQFGMYSCEVFTIFCSS